MTITQDGIFVSDEILASKNLAYVIKPHASIGHLLVDSLSEESRSKMVIFVDAASGRQWTGAQLKAKILSVSAALIDLYNFKRGTCVCIDYDHTDHTVILVLAVILAGGSVACAFPKDPYAELLYLAKKVGPKFLFCHKKNIHWAKQLSKDLNYEVKAIAMDVDCPTSEEKEEEENLTLADGYLGKLFNYDGSKSSSMKSLPIACDDTTSEVALIIMSSGTTGQPKAIPVTHSMIINETFGITRQKGDGLITVASIASLDYVSGRLIVTGAIRSGYRAIIMNGFEPKTLLEAIEKFKINIMYMGAASFYNLIIYKDLDKFDISSLMVAFPMGAKITYLKELRQFMEKHPHIKSMSQGYGSSETNGVAIKRMTPMEYLDNSDCCGKLLFTMEAKIVDPVSGKPMGSNDIGVLHIRGPTVIPGYYDVARQNTDNSKKVNFIRDSSTFDEDGFYITGDMAYFNENEELYIVGRMKELMCCRGSKKVLPEEIELLLLEHPAVLKACVLGILNKIELTLHCPRAYIVVKPICYEMDVAELSLTQPPGSRVPEEPLEYEGTNKLCRLPIEKQHKILEDVMEFLNERIGWEKQLTGGIVLVDEMPTLRETGKINKSYLRSLTTNLVEIYGDRSG